MPATRRAAAVSIRRSSGPLEAARAAAERGEYATALRLLGDARPERRDERAAATLLQARALLALDRPADAAALLKRFKDVEGAEESTRATMLLGAALTQTGRRTQGDALLDEAAAAARSLPELAGEIAYHRALSRWSAYALDDADTIVDEALPRARGADRARLLQMLGWIDVRRENYAAAARAFIDALEELDASGAIDVKGRARALHGLAIIAAETVDLRLGRTVRRAYDGTAWGDDTRTEHGVVLGYLAWLSLLEGNVPRAWDECQLVLTLTVDTSRHAGALVEAAGISGFVGDHFAERRYLALASSLLLRGDQVDLDLEQRVAMLQFAAAVPAAELEAAKTVLNLYEHTRARGNATLAFEGDRRVGALEAFARGKVLLADGSAREGIAEMVRALDLWTRFGYRLRAALAANALRWATGERRYAERALDALRSAPAAWMREPLVRRTTDDDPLAQLTPAERRVLKELCAGKRSREIAAGFGRSFNTINNHTRRIFSVFGVRSRAALVAKCARLGILDDVRTTP